MGDKAATATINYHELYRLMHSISSTLTTASETNTFASMQHAMQQVGVSKSATLPANQGLGGFYDEVDARVKLIPLDAHVRGRDTRRQANNTAHTGSLHVSLSTSDNERRSNPASPSGECRVI